MPKINTLLFLKIVTESLPRVIKVLMLSLWLATTGTVAQANLVSATKDALDQFEGVAVLEDRQGQWTIDQVREAGAPAWAWTCTQPGPRGR